MIARHRMLLLLVTGILLAVPTRAADGTHIRLFYSTDFQGALEPCG